MRANNTHHDFRFAMANMLAQRIHVAVDKKKLFVPNPGGAYFITVPGPDRAICVFHPQGVTDVEQVLSDRFQAYLSERLDRRVEISAGAYLYVQVAYEPRRSIRQLPDYVALDLTQRPGGRLMVPVAITKRGPLWLSLLDMDAVIIGGTRRFGKTTWLHGLILSLVTAESSHRVKLYLYDGKDGLEFNRYASVRHVTYLESGEDLAKALGDLRVELEERSQLMKENKVREIGSLPAAVRPPYIVLVIDELKEALEGGEGIAEVLADLISRGGAYGVHPVLATQRPDSSTVAGFLKCNCPTRISLPVPTAADSITILGRGGAEKIAKKRGRILFEWGGRMVEGQSFHVPVEMIEDIVSRLHAGQAPLKPPLSLEDWQKDLVRIAMRGTRPNGEPFGGRFGPNEDLAQVSGVSRRQIERLGPVWEQQGLLGSVEYEEGTGHKLSRPVRDRLLQLAGLQGGAED
jgi:hypothetical protein